MLAPQSDVIKPTESTNQQTGDSKPTNENSSTDSQSEKKKSLPPKTEVDHFYRALMDDFKTETGIEPNDDIQVDDYSELEETRDFSKTEELFEADLVAVENSIVTGKTFSIIGPVYGHILFIQSKTYFTVGSDENENEIHDTEALRLDEPEPQPEVEPEVVEENNENSILELSAVEEQLSDLRKSFFCRLTHIMKL